MLAAAGHRTSDLSSSKGEIKSHCLSYSYGIKKGMCLSYIGRLSHSPPPPPPSVAAFGAGAGAPPGVELGPGSIPVPDLLIDVEVGGL